MRAIQILFITAGGNKSSKLWRFQFLRAFLLGQRAVLKFEGDEWKTHARQLPPQSQENARAGTRSSLMNRDLLTPRAAGSADAAGAERTTLPRMRRGTRPPGPGEGGGGSSPPGRRCFQAPRSRLVTGSGGSLARRCGPAPGAPAEGRTCLPRRPSDEAHPRVREAGRGGQAEDFARPRGIQDAPVASAGSRDCQFRIQGQRWQNSPGLPVKSRLSQNKSRRLPRSPGAPQTSVSELGDRCWDMQIPDVKGGVAPPRASPGGRSPQVQ
uniref:uncharacterized protein LOC114671805 n=1 Tax=Macaca mulatta TaxID=9544 RepID=UPI0010A29F4E|nr:uncharacterized protein LOC114671805 [Macaca mulatta]